MTLRSWAYCRDLAPHERALCAQWCRDQGIDPDEITTLWQQEEGTVDAFTFLRNDAGDFYVVVEDGERVVAAEWRRHQVQSPPPFLRWPPRTARAAQPSPPRGDDSRGSFDH